MFSTFVAKLFLQMKQPGIKRNVYNAAQVLMVTLLLAVTIPVATSCNKRAGVKPGGEVKHNTKRKCKCSKKTTRWRPQSSIKKVVPANLSESTQTNNKLT